MEIMNFSIIKIPWVLRAIYYKIQFGKLLLPSYLGKPFYISQHRKNILWGKMVRIYPGLRMEIIDRNGKIIIGDNVSIGQNFHITSYKAPLTIGNNTTISGNVMINNNDHNYRKINEDVLTQGLSYAETKIGENCFIGFGSVILPGTKLGNHCIVGANSVVRGEFPDNTVIVGAPARIVKKYDSKIKKWVKVDG